MRQTPENIGIASRKHKSWNDKPTTHTLTPSLKLEKMTMTDLLSCGLTEALLLSRNAFGTFIKSLRKENTGISPLKDKG